MDKFHDVIEDLKMKNDNLSELLEGKTTQAQNLQEENRKFKSVISDCKSALMDWMPKLRHTDNETAQEIAVAMRKLIEEKING